MNGENIHILLIEDDSQSVVFMRQALRRTPLDHHEYLIDVATSLSDAVEFLKEKTFDIVLIDASCHEADTAQAHPLDRIRSLFPQMPIVILADNDDEAMAIQAVSHGAQDYLLKPHINSYYLKRVIVYSIEREQLLIRLERHSEERFRQMTEKSADGMIVVDTTGMVCFANPAVESIFEKDASTITGNKFDFHTLLRHDLLGDNSVDNLSLKYITLLAKTGKATELEVSLDNDTTKLVEMRATEMDWESKQAYLVVFHDITNLMRLQRLKAEIFERERVAKLKDEFISTVSHELRTPLAIVKCAVENMREGVAGPLSEKQDKVVKIASSNVDRLTRLIDDILDLSRLEAGAIKLSSTECLVQDLIQDTVKRFGLLAKEHHFELMADVDSKDMRVEIDVDKISQVLDNLLGNAFRFTQSKITLRARLLDQNEQTIHFGKGANWHLQEFLNEHKTGVWISVIDDGHGIAQEKLESLFNKFVQIDRPAGGAGYKGTGLGLSICKEIVELHRGKIWVESEYGHGAQFHFILPQHQTHPLKQSADENVTKEL